MDELAVGTLVTGPFFSSGAQGTGVIVKRGREIWTRVGEGYVPVKVISGDRCSGGYRRSSLTDTGYKVTR